MRGYKTVLLFSTFAGLLWYGAAWPWTKERKHLPFILDDRVLQDPAVLEYLATATAGVPPPPINLGPQDKEVVDQKDKGAAEYGKEDEDEIPRVGEWWKEEGLMGVNSEPEPVKVKENANRTQQRDLTESELFLVRAAVEHAMEECHTRGLLTVSYVLLATFVVMAWIMYMMNVVMRRLSVVIEKLVEVRRDLDGMPSGSRASTRALTQPQTKVHATPDHTHRCIHADEQREIE